MTADTELDVWQRLWQSEKAVPPDLRVRVRRQSRIMRISVAGDVLVTIVVGGGITGWTVRSAQADVVVLALATWFFLAAAWAFSLISRRRCWSPAALTTSAFLDLSIRRCHGSIALTSFGAVLCLSELLFSLGWVYYHLSRQKALSLASFLSSNTILAVGLCTFAFLGTLLWYRRWKQAELSCLLRLQAEQTLPT